LNSNTAFTFFGSEPRSAHVPPKGLESTTATCRPALRQPVAAADAADPVPITTTSNFLIILSFGSGAISRILKPLQRFASVQRLASSADYCPDENARPRHHQVCRRRTKLRSGLVNAASWERTC
jgi:hypothetical protein